MPLHSINVHDRKEEFKPTTEELKIIGDKMKDPEFVKLMHEYMQSLEDPETRKEEEAYLEQMEKEAKEGGDYSFDFVFPKASFVIQLQQTPGEKQPVYVNMCTSDKVDEFREETTNNRMGSNWHVPVAVSQSRDEQFEGSTVTVYDAAFHPKTLELSFRSNRFLCFLAEIVVENVNQGYQKRYGFEFNRLGSNVVSIGVPKNQTIRRKNGEAAFPVSPEPVSRGPIRPPPASHKDPAAAPQTTAAPPPPPPAAAAPTASTKLSGPTLPVFQIAHRGEIDLSDAWNWKVVDKRIGIPKELVVRIELPGVTSAAHLDLDIADGYLELARSTHHRFGGTIPLPFTVDATPKSAKFDKSKQQLTLTLSVIPPSMPEDVRAFHDERKAQQQTTTTTTADGSNEAAGANKEVSVGESSVAAAAAVSSSSLSTSDSTISAIASVDPAATTTPSVPPPPSEVDTPTAPPPTVANPQLTHLEPNDRVAAMMAKLEEARKERERSEAEEKAKEEAAAAAAATPPPPPATPLVSEDAPEVIDLRKQQLEWKRAIEEEQTARAKAAAEAEAAEAEKAAEALRKAEREVQKQKRLQREAEALEEALRKKMEELPLKSHYIFDIQ